MKQGSVIVDLAAEAGDDFENVNQSRSSRDIRILTSVATLSLES